MMIGKLITLNILGLLAMLNTFYTFFNNGILPFSLSNDYFSHIAQGGFLILLIWLLILISTLNSAANRALHKKNMLRVPLVFFVVLLLISISLRINEALNGTYCIPCYIQTVLYLLIIIVLYLMLKNLHITIDTLLSEKKQV